MISHIIDLFWKAKIDELDVTMFVQKNVFRLQISVNDIPFMQLLDGDQNLSKVKDRIFQSEAHLLPDLPKKLPAWQILEQKVQILLVLHRLNEIYKEAALGAWALMR